MKKLNICVTVFSDPDAKTNCLKGASLLSSDGTDNGNLNVFFGDEIRIPFTDKGDQPAKNCYSLKLAGVEYDKRVYSPGTLKAEFTVSKVDDVGTSLEDAVESSLAGIRASLLGFNSTEEEAETITETGTKTVTTITYSDALYPLDDYCLQSVCKVDSDGTSCVLTWRSPDYQLTEERGCEVFESRKFGQDIFAAKAGGMRCECSTERLLMMGYNSSASRRDGYQKKDNEDVIGHDDEIIQPYLVRYNESVYDFLIRVAHRCGEFLYYECDENGGKFCLGLPGETVEHIVQGKGYMVPEKMPLCSYSDLGGDDEEDAVGFSSDYMQKKDSVKEDGTYYDLQHTSDDFQYRISEDDDPSAKSALKVNQEITKMLSPIFTANDIISGLTASAAVLLQDVVDAYAINKDKLHKQFEKYREESENSTSTFKYGLNNSFLHIVETCEEKARRHTVTLDYADSIPTVRIGEDIDLQDGMYSGYVISRVSGSFSYSTDSASLKTSNLAEAVPVMDVSGLGTLPRMAFPPAADIPHSVKASSMEAIVVRTDDPMLIGRVKVRYPWQFNEDGDPDESTEVPKKSNIPLSPWIRVITPFAGNPDSGGGVYFPHSVGEHVLLGYVDGNIERPYVSGSLYYREAGDSDSDGPEAHGPEKGNFEDPALKFYKTEFETRSIISAKGHGLMFKDTPDTSPLSLIPFLGVIEQIIKAAMGETECVVDAFKGGGMSIGDATGILSLEMDADKRNVDLSSPLGSMSVSAFTGITVNVPNGDVCIEGKNVFIEAGNNLTIKSGTNIRRNRDSSYAGEMVGKLLGSTVSKVVSQTVGLDLTGCLDLSFLRCIMEIMLRPVEGTLRIHSGRNTTVTAGSGEVMIPTNLLHEVSQKADDKNYSKDIIESFNKAGEAVNSFISESHSLREKLKNAIEDFQKAITNNGTIGRDKLTVTYQGYTDPADGLKKVIENFCNVSGAVAANANEIYGSREKEYLAAYQKIKKAHSELQKTAKKYKKSFIQLEALKSKLKKLENVSVDKFEEGWKKPNIFSADDWKEWDDGAVEIKTWKKQMLRDIIIQIILGSDQIRLLKSKDAADKVISANAPEVVDAGGYREWPKEFESGDKAQLNSYIEGKDHYSWTEISTALVDSFKDDANTPETILDKVKTFGKGALGGAASVLGGGAEYDSDEKKWKFFPQGKKLVNYHGEAGPRSFAAVGNTTEGGIMFSNTKGATIQVKDDTTNWVSHLNGEYAKALSEWLKNKMIIRKQAICYKPYVQTSNDTISRL